MPNAPQKYARQPSQYSSAAQQQPMTYATGPHFPQHVCSHSNPQQQLQQQQQRRHLASPFPVAHHGPTTPGTPTGSSAASPSSRMLTAGSNIGRDDNALKVYNMTPPVDVLPLLRDSSACEFFRLSFALRIRDLISYYHVAGYPDFFPWNGNHAEDQLTENYIQHGYEDKPYLSVCNNS